MPSWSVVFVAIVIGVLCVAGYVFAPKGDNQTYKSLRTCPPGEQGLLILMGAGYGGTRSS
jgi:hypothetical protein